MKRLISSCGMCFSMFSILPMPSKLYDRQNSTLMLMFMPLVGLFIGAAWWGVAALVMRYLGMSYVGCAAAAMTPYLLSGFIHLDGFMDVSDAVLSHRSLEEKLRIMKDSHTGAMAVISAIILFIFTYAATLSLVQSGCDPRVFMALPIMTRSCSALSVAVGKPLAHSQYHSQRRVFDVTCVVVAALVGMVAPVAVALYALGIFGVAVLSAPVVFLVCLLILYRQFKGVSGDICGYSLCVAETASLCVLAAISEVLL